MGSCCKKQRLKAKAKTLTWKFLWKSVHASKEKQNVALRGGFIEFWEMFKILAITLAGLFLGALSDWMSKSVKESPSDSVFIRNNSVKVKIKTQQTNWKSSLISILKERN